MCIEIKVVGSQGITRHNGNTADAIFKAIGYKDKTNLPKSKDYNIEIRIVGNDNLTDSERDSINSYITSLGYKDINDLSKRFGFSSPSSLASAYSFSSVRDFFLANGWQERLAPFRK